MTASPLLRPPYLWVRLRAVTTPAAHAVHVSAEVLNRQLGSPVAYRLRPLAKRTFVHDKQCSAFTGRGGEKREEVRNG